MVLENTTLSHLHLSCLRTKWQDRIPDKTAAKSQLKWTGHVTKMSSTRLPNKSLKCPWSAFRKPIAQDWPVLRGKVCVKSVHLCAGLDQHRCLEEPFSTLLINSSTLTQTHTHFLPSSLSPISIPVSPQGQSLGPPADRTATLTFTSEGSWRSSEMSSWMSQHDLRPWVNTSPPKHCIVAKKSCLDIRQPGRCPVHPAAWSLLLFPIDLIKWTKPSSTFNNYIGYAAFKVSVCCRLSPVKWLILFSNS